MRALLAVLVLSSSALPAAAQTHAAQGAVSDSDAARARELFEQGVELSREERWSEALDAFRASRALASRPSAIYNIATALQRLGRAVEAIATVQEYLSIADPVEYAAQRAQAEQMRDLLYSTLVRLTVVVTPETAELSVDGRPVPSVGSEREVVLDPGDHALAATAAGHVSVHVQLTLASGARVRRQLTLERVPEQSAQLVVRTSPSNAHVLVDDTEVGVGDGDVHVLAGRHVVRVRAERHRELRRIVVVAPGERLAVDARLAPVDGGNLLEEPVFWIVATAIVLAGGAAGVTAGVLTSEPAPYEGSWGVSIAGLRF